MVGVKRTALAPGELVVAATVPVLDGYQGFAKVGVRNAMVISVTSACLVVDRAGADGAARPRRRRPHRRAGPRGRGVAGRRAALGRRRRCHRAWPTSSAGRAAAAARPIDDHRSTAAYRRHAVAVLAAGAGADVRDVA